MQHKRSWYLKPADTEPAALDQLGQDRVLLKLASAPRQRLMCERELRNLGQRIVRFGKVKRPCHGDDVSNHVAVGEEQKWLGGVSVVLNDGEQGERME